MKKVEKILVPVDFSDNSSIILNAARYVAENFSADLILLFVVQSLEDYSGFFVPHLPLDQLADEMLEGANNKMANFIKTHLSQKGQVESIVLTGDVSEEIIAYAEHNDVDIIVMGTHGYKGLEKILFGSVAEQVVKNAPCPVLTVNPYKQKER